MKKKLAIYLNRIRELLWFKPLLFCFFSVVGALIAQKADGLGLDFLVPSIKLESIEGLLDTISSSMLVISIFAVASMISAFSSASSTATPRAFRITITDDVSQNALSVFIGAFIFSIVATVALDNGFYGKTGKFLLFVFTLLLFVVVILTFLRWVDRISRLGQLEHTIHKMEAVASKSLTEYIQHPFLKALPIIGKFKDGKTILSNAIGYVQHINMSDLQALAEETNLKIQLHCIPGSSIHMNTLLASISTTEDIDIKEITQKINDAIHVGHTRFFDDDPRFGLIALSEIASRALSPGINDPGTAIQIIGSHERLFFLWNKNIEGSSENKVLYDRIEVPQIPIEDFFDDAFRPISRDGANNIEVMLRLQKAYSAIVTIDHSQIKAAAYQYSQQAFQRAEVAIKFESDLELLKKHSLQSE